LNIERPRTVCDSRVVGVGRAASAVGLAVRGVSEAGEGLPAEGLTEAREAGARVYEFGWAGAT
jgi:hypothetical protein